jgi:hypothetical protein
MDKTVFIYEPSPPIRRNDSGKHELTTEALSTTEGTDFEISSSVISVVLSVSVVEKCPLLIK